MLTEVLSSFSEQLTMKSIFCLMNDMEWNYVHNLHIALEESKFAIKRSIRQ